MFCMLDPCDVVEPPINRDILEGRAKNHSCSFLRAEGWILVTLSLCTSETYRTRSHCMASFSVASLEEGKFGTNLQATVENDSAGM